MVRREETTTIRSREGRSPTAGSGESGVKENMGKSSPCLQEARRQRVSNRKRVMYLFATYF
jgi:hypothetical protein